MRSLWWLIATCLATYKFTQKQARIARKLGVNVSNSDVDITVQQGRTTGFRGASNILAQSWENPVGFDENHLRVPYRFKTVDFSPEEMKIMRDGLNEMSSRIDFCIEFYDDTEWTAPQILKFSKTYGESNCFDEPLKTQKYSTGYVLIRNTDESGNYDDGCWSNVGFVNPRTYQNLNMGKNCVGKGTMQHEMIHALGKELRITRSSRGKPWNG